MLRMRPATAEDGAAVAAMVRHRAVRMREQAVETSGTPDDEADAAAS